MTVSFNNSYTSVPEVEPLALISEMEQGASPVLLDCRELYEWRQMHLDGSLHIPMNEIPQRLVELDRQAEIIVICAHGERSRIVTHWLNQQGYHSRSLRGGLAAWPEINK